MVNGQGMMEKTHTRNSLDMATRAKKKMVCIQTKQDTTTGTRSRPAMIMKTMRTRSRPATTMTLTLKARSLAMATNTLKALAMTRVM